MGDHRGIRSGMVHSSSSTAAGTSDPRASRPVDHNHAWQSLHRTAKRANTCALNEIEGFCASMGDRFQTSWGPFPHTKYLGIGCFGQGMSLTISDCANRTDHRCCRGRTEGRSLAAMRASNRASMSRSWLAGPKRARRRGPGADGPRPWAGQPPAGRWPRLTGIFAG